MADDRSNRIARELARTLREAAYADVVALGPNNAPGIVEVVAWWDAEEGVFVTAELTVNEP